MNNNTTEPAPPPAAAQPPAEELLKKIQELELGHAHLKQEMSKLITSSTAEIMAADRQHRQRSHSISPQRAPRRAVDGGDGSVVAAWKKGSMSFRHSSPLQRESRNRDAWSGGGGSGPSPQAVKFTDKQYLNILQSMGQSVHIFDLNCRIIYWNRTAENLYGYSAAEALGQDAIELLTDPRDFGVANNIVHRVTMGELDRAVSVKNKRGERFLAIATNTPFYDDDGTLVGIICVSNDSKPFQEAKSVISVSKDSENNSSLSRNRSIASSALGLDPQQPLQAAIASKITNLASKVSNKVKSKMRPTENYSDHEGGSGDSHHSDRGFSDAAMSDHREDELQVELVLQEETYILLRLECSLGPTRKILPQKSGSNTLKSENVVNETNRTANNEGAPGSWSPSVNVNSTSSASSCGSTSSSAVNKVDMDTDCLDYEILWEDLTIGEQIGQGSCGTVYHALWVTDKGQNFPVSSCNMNLYLLQDVAVKVFSKQEYSDDVIFSFRQESFFHGILYLCIFFFFLIYIFFFCPKAISYELIYVLFVVIEFYSCEWKFVPLLQRNTSKLEWRRRIHMALDIARGMNYLHHCNPPIVHHDLKSSNLLVDKNWTVKPQWMAPEVLRNEPSDEKADVYSYGVILWELVTQKIPWESLNSMQVIGAVGFMNQRLDMPKDIDPQWASLIESCWHSEPQCRPSFQELVEKLKELQRKYAIQYQAGRATQKEL
ncbi:hypothetical protein DH2020_004360 [Rehmannia glutinosa]|uniref:Uncharacterized protein n=1 Tax=Rehmannia glutinosa TaxID=99300 RepID=A0ABR0XPY7_REHGL